MAKIHDLLNNDILLDEIKEYVESGSSINVIEAKLMLPSGTFKNWLIKGKEKPRTPYRRLYTLYRSWAAEATATAQSNMLCKNPSRWLETNSTGKMIEPPEESTALALSPGVPVGQGMLQLPVEALVAGLRAMMESGHSLSQAVNKPITLEQANGGIEPETPTEKGHNPEEESSE